MVFDNSHYAVKNKLTRMTLIVVTAAVIATLAMLPELDKKLGFSRLFLSAGWLLVMAVLLGYRYLRNYNFVYFSTDLGKITVRYYQLVTMFKKYKTFEFPLNELHKFEVIQKGMKHDLVLYRREGAKITRYPALSVTALKKDDIAKITASLQTILGK